MTGSRRVNGFAYYVIDSDHSEGSPRYKVWKRTSHASVAVLFGSFPTFEAAKAAVPIPWHTGHELVAAWGWGADVTVPIRPAASIMQSSPTPRPAADLDEVGGTEKTG